MSMPTSALTELFLSDKFWIKNWEKLTGFLIPSQLVQFSLPAAVLFWSNARVAAPCWVAEKLFGHCWGSEMCQHGTSGKSCRCQMCQNLAMTNNPCWHNSGASHYFRGVSVKNFSKGITAKNFPCRSQAFWENAIQMLPSHLSRPLHA